MEWIEFGTNLENVIPGLVHAILGGNDVLKVEGEAHVEDDVEEEHEAGVSHGELVHGARGIREVRPTRAHAYERKEGKKPSYI